MMRIKAVLDYDGTLTAEEEQVSEVTRRSLLELAEQILCVPLEELQMDYERTAARLQAAPQDYGWEVDGVRVSYCDEGAFTFSTATLQATILANAAYTDAVEHRFAGDDHDAVSACTTHLFHAHTAMLESPFRKATREVLEWLTSCEQVEPLVLTNSLTGKVEKNLKRLTLPPIRIIGNARQYQVDSSWTLPFNSVEPVLMVDKTRKIDLRRRAYYAVLARELTNTAQMLVVADTLSLPGALPLAMGIPFALLRTCYTPDWCLSYVAQHPLGTVLKDLANLPAHVEQLVAKAQGRENRDL